MEIVAPKNVWRGCACPLEGVDQMQDVLQRPLAYTMRFDPRHHLTRIADVWQRQAGGRVRGKAVVTIA